MASSNSSAGVNIPSTQVWDVTEVKDVDVTKPEFKELLVRMYQNLNQMSITINNKESSYFDTDETVKGQAFFPNPALNSSTPTTPEYRQSFNKVINFGALPSSTTKSVAHGISINSGYTFTRIYGSATNTTALTAIPLPYVDPASLANGILLSVDGTNVNIKTAANYSAYNITYIVLEYIKN
jgi:hypothetical protein